MIPVEELHEQINSLIKKGKNNAEIFRSLRDTFLEHPDPISIAINLAMLCELLAIEKDMTTPRPHIMMGEPVTVPLTNRYITTTTTNTANIKKRNP